jgi:hypothetical protein
MPEAIQAHARVRCNVSLGMFSNERGARIELPTGETVSVIVDRSQVHVEREPGAGEEVDGWLDVAIVREADNQVVIDLPQPSFTSGTRLAVPDSFVRRAA